MPLFSVVIPTCDRPDLLRRCLDALAPGGQTYPEVFETIVTDDGRTPVASLVRKEYPGVIWTSGPRRGPAANRNHGASHARGTWLAFTDDDCVPARAWLSAYHEAISSSADAAALEGAIHPNGDLTKDLAECPVNLEGGCFWSANVCIRRDLFLSLSGFDEHFPTAEHEDQDLFLRLKANTIVPFIKDAIVIHPVRYSTLWRSITKMNKSCHSWLYFVRKNAEALSCRSNREIVAAWYSSQSRAALRAIRHRHPKKLLCSLTMLVYGVPFLASSLDHGWKFGIKVL